MTSLSIPFLRTHSYFDLLGSLLSPQALVKHASAKGIKSLALTDHRYLTGSIDFYEACHQAGIKPILGLKIDLMYKGYQGNLILLAKDRSGWSNLSRLSTKTLTEQTHLDFQVLASHQQGLICITGDPNDIIREIIIHSPQSKRLANQFLGALIDIYQSDCFMELQRYENGPLKNENALLTLAKFHRLPIIATQTIFYGKREDHNTFRTLTALKHNTALKELSKILLPPGSAHFPTMENFAYRFNDLPEALTNLKEIEERCHLDLPIGQILFPEFPTPSGESQSEYLHTRAFTGAEKKYKKLTPEITERLLYELSVISEMGYEPIFLIVEDVLNHARKLGIPISSRGSAASSLVAHCLNITSPDPLALNLYFERFLNPARLKPPDIDTDIASHRRDEVIQYVFDKYGSDRVAMVGTINRYRPKSALSDVARVYGLSSETIRQLSRKLPSSYRFQHDNQHKDPFSALDNDHSIPVLKKIISDARAILDNPKHLSVHPGGLVISPFPITDMIPLIHSASLGVNHVQFDLEGIEKFGLVKIDLLGIRGLTVLGEVAERIQSWHRSEFKDGLQVLENIPQKEILTAETVSEAKTLGCFQIESPGMRATLREINAANVADIMTALALYRPGPLRGGLRDAFVRRFRGEEPVTHIHQSLTHLLDDTLGVILYQEQVLRIAHELGGLSITDADILRRAMSHFDPGRVMDTLRKRFIEGAAQHKNVPPEIADRIWEMMAAFAGYGFPKAHAASYAQLAWQSAWCKTHYPAEFMSAVLGYGGGYYSQRVYLMEAHRLGLQINPPHINHSNYRFHVAYPKSQPVLYMGLNQVRGLSHHTACNIRKMRPFHSFDDFLTRVDPQKKEALHLVLCGAIEGLTTIPQGIQRVEQVRLPGQMALFSSEDNVPDWPIEKKQMAQQDILGVNLVMSPFEQYADQIHSAGAISTLEAQTLVGEKVKVAGMRQTMRRSRSRSREIMGYLILEDMEGSLPIIILPRLYRKVYSLMNEPGPFIIEGVIESEGDQQDIRLIAEEVTLITD